MNYTMHDNGDEFHSARQWGLMLCNGDDLLKVEQWK